MVSYGFVNFHPVIPELTSSLQVQTKFTPHFGHPDGETPYDSHGTLEGQVEESIKQSLEHLQVEYLDCVFLHSPYGLEEDNMRVWKALESHVPHHARYIGLSNVSLSLLMKVHSSARIRPSFVQNRFHLRTKYDIDLRKFAQSNAIVYQAFGMLHACPEILQSGALDEIADRLSVKRELALYAVMAAPGNVQILTGTTNETHMIETLTLFRDMLSNPPLRATVTSFVNEFEVLLNDIVSYATSRGSNKART